MKPYPRIRKTVKWGASVVSVLLAVLWLRSEWIQDGYRAKGWQACCEFGAVEVRIMPLALADGYVQGPIMGEGSYRFWWWSSYSSSVARGWILPLWIPLALVVVSAVAAWGWDALAGRGARTSQGPTAHSVHGS